MLPKNILKQIKLKIKIVQRIATVSMLPTSHTCIRVCVCVCVQKWEMSLTLIGWRHSQTRKITKKLRPVFNNEFDPRGDFGPKGWALYPWGNVHPFIHPQG
jgi:hypothetical protein